MLIDVSRKPVRLIPEECRSVVVVRTLAVRGGADGMIHQDMTFQATKRRTTLPPAVTVPNGEAEHIETIFPPPNTLVPEAKARYGLLHRPEHHTVSAYQDQMTKRSGTWRINFIFDATQKEDYLLTLFDETNAVMLFTVHVPPTHESVFGIATPLKRWLNRQMIGAEGAAGLWGAVLDDDDF